MDDDRFPLSDLSVVLLPRLLLLALLSKASSRGELLSSLPLVSESVSADILRTLRLLVSSLAGERIIRACALFRSKLKSKLAVGFGDSLPSSPLLLGVEGSPSADRTCKERTDRVRDRTDFSLCGLFDGDAALNRSFDDFDFFLSNGGLAS